MIVRETITAAMGLENGKGYLPYIQYEFQCVLSCLEQHTEGFKCLDFSVLSGKRRSGQSCSIEKDNSV